MSTISRLSALNSLIRGIFIAAVLALSLLASAGQASADPGQGTTWEDTIQPLFDTLGVTWDE